MPGEDLLRFVGGPLPYSPVWLLLAIVLLIVVIAWWTAVFVWTAPPARLRRVPVIRDLHRTLTRRRFVRSVRRITAQYRGEALSRAEAGAGYGRVLRSFLFVRTGIAAQYLHTGEIAHGELAQAAPLFERIDDAQFNTESDVDMLELGADAERLISTWE